VPKFKTIYPSIPTVHLSIYLSIYPIVLTKKLTVADLHDPGHRDALLIELDVPVGGQVQNLGSAEGVLVVDGLGVLVF